MAKKWSVLKSLAASCHTIEWLMHRDNPIWPAFRASLTVLTSSGSAYSVVAILFIDLGLLLVTEARVMVPNSTDFCFFRIITDSQGHNVQVSDTRHSG